MKYTTFKNMKIGNEGHIFDKIREQWVRRTVQLIV